MNIKLITLTDEEVIKEVPDTMLHLLVYLNGILKCDPESITKLIDYDVSSNNIKEIDEKCTNLILRENNKISVLGLIANFVNTSKYKIYAEFENDSMPFGNIIKFGAMKVVENEI